MPGDPSTLGKTSIAPMKVNAFEVARQSNAQLLPLFPYLHAGAIVPCSASFESDGKGTHIGYFLHENSVDEVAFTLASNGRARSGEMRVGPNVHGVGGDSTEAYFAVMVITQRQVESGDQPEAMSFTCEKCNGLLLRHEFDVHTGAEGRFPGLPTIIGSFDAATAVNNRSGALTCKSCGHGNRPFPLPMWGWASYVRNTRIVEKGWDAMQEAGR